MSWDEPSITSLRIARYFPPMAYVQEGGGPVRVESGPEDPTFKRRPVGFATVAPPAGDPLLWEGDGA